MKRAVVCGVIFGMMAVFGLTSWAWAKQDRTDVEERLQSAAKTLRSLENAQTLGIPNDIMKNAKCVAVVPSMIKGGFIFGAVHGRGVSTCKLPDGAWSAPAFFTITGGNWGLQIGVEDVQLVLLAMSDQGMKHLLSSKFKIGADVSGAIGPMGRDVSASESWKMDAPLLTYSRAKGAFAGVDLGGSEIERDGDSTKAEYGNDLSNDVLLTGGVPVPPNAHVFTAAVSRSENEAMAKSNAK